MLQSSRKPIADQNEEAMLEELRRVSRKLGKTPTQAEFDETSKLFKAQVYKKKFAKNGKLDGWNNALGKADVQVKRTQKSVKPEYIFKLLESYESKIGTKPTRDDFIKFVKQNGSTRFGRGIIENQFGNWNKLLDEYNDGGRQVQFTSDDNSRHYIKSEPIKSVDDSSFKSYKTIEKGEYTGSKIFPRAPLSEQGVVFLFGLLSKCLGYVVEGVRIEFPDCSATKINSKGRLVECLIEFELMSSSYKKHQHPIIPGIIIVCWEHDWKDMPEVLEVICLKDELKRLENSGLL